MTTMTFTKTAPPPWLLAMWKEIDDKTFGKGFDCFAEDADLQSRRRRLARPRGDPQQSARTSSTRVLPRITTSSSIWDSPLLKIFHGKVAMTFDDPSIAPVRPTMTHFFYMDEGSDQGQALDRIGRPDRLLERRD